MSKLAGGTPHFVRCIKPNTSRQPLTFRQEYVQAQLRYTGIADIVKIRKHGFAVRLTYHEFVKR